MCSRRTQVETPNDHVRKPRTWARRLSPPRSGAIRPTLRYRKRKSACQSTCPSCWQTGRPQPERSWRFESKKGEKRRGSQAGSPFPSQECKTSRVTRRCEHRLTRRPQCPTWSNGCGGTREKKCQPKRLLEALMRITNILYPTREETVPALSAAQLQGVSAQSRYHSHSSQLVHRLEVAAR